jgi:hypothetical protein
VAGVALKCLDFGFGNYLGAESATDSADLFYKRFGDEVLLIAENSLVLSLYNLKTFETGCLE